MTSVTDRDGHCLLIYIVSKQCDRVSHFNPAGITLIAFFIDFVFLLIFYICLDEILSSGIFKNQITTLVITIDNNNKFPDEITWSLASIGNYILTVFTNLAYLIFYESSYKNRVPLRFDDDAFLPTFRSSTLSRLYIRVRCFDDCLYLLDGRFNQLHTLSVDFVNIRRPQENINQVSFIRKTFMLSNNKRNIIF